MLLPSLRIMITQKMIKPTNKINVGSRLINQLVSAGRRISCTILLSGWSSLYWSMSSLTSM